MYEPETKADEWTLQSLYCPVSMVLEKLNTTMQCVNLLLF